MSAHPATRALNKFTPADHDSLLTLARGVLRTEAEALLDLEPRLGDAFLAAVALILHSPGRVIVSGMGKSGHIARKIAATLASTGTPAFFVHPGEASHGDMGMITPDDVIIAIWPYIAALLVGVVVIAAVPTLSTFML